MRVNAIVARPEIGCFCVRERASKFLLRYKFLQQPFRPSASWHVLVIVAADLLPVYHPRKAQRISSAITSMGSCTITLRTDDAY